MSTLLFDNRTCPKLNGVVGVGAVVVVYGRAGSQTKLCHVSFSLSVLSKIEVWQKSMQTWTDF